MGHGRISDECPLWVTNGHKHSSPNVETPIRGQPESDGTVIIQLPQLSLSVPPHSDDHRCHRFFEFATALQDTFRI